MDENVDNQNTNLTNDQAALDNMSDTEVYEAFVVQMMNDKGLDVLSDETFAGLKDDLMARLSFQINRAIVAQLPEDKLRALGTELDADTMTAEKLDQLIAEQNIDVTKTVEDTMLTFRNVYLNGTTAEA